MASPFTLEEKTSFIRNKKFRNQKTKIAEILTTYTYDKYNNSTLQ